MKINILSLKHWKIFILQFIIPFVTPLLILIIGIRYFDFQLENNIQTFDILITTPLVLFLSIFWVWSWKALKKIDQKLEEIKLTASNITYFINILTNLTLLVLIRNEFNIGGLMIEGGELSMTLALILISLLLISVYTKLSIISFLSKGLKSIELKRKAILPEYSIYLCLFVFYFIGIWIIQPKINKTIVNTV